MKNKIRITFQFIFLALIIYVAARPIFDKAYLSDFEKYCPFGGISSFFSKLNQDTMACNMSETQLMLGLVLLLGAGFIGKLFCSYVCPIGTVSEWIGRLGDKLKIRREVSAILDRPLRILKYVLLFITIYITMTTSELFCKEYDPYFAVVNLFNNTDINLYFAIAALAVTVLGALFFRLFWCKYLCPLGAISNVFLNVPAAGAVVVVYFTANYFGAQLSLIWLLGGLVLVGMINEVGFMKSYLMPFPKISTNKDTCTDCSFCKDKCPMGINVSATPTVTHIDCHLCTDCVYNCPHKNVLSVSNKKNLKYLAPISVVVLIAISLGLASFYELTTISEKWGKPAGALSVYKQSGLKNIKCYGSSMALKGTIENIEGIYGLDTYAKSHTVKIYYDPAVISENKVKKSLFTPIKMEVNKIKNGEIDSVQVLKIGIFGMFDLIDFNNLWYSFKETKGILGFETHYGEPVVTNVFYDPSKISPANIKKQIEKDEIIAHKPKGDEKIEIDFEAENDGQVLGKISLPDYRQRIFRLYDRLFNDYKTFSQEQLSVLVFKMPEAGVPALRRYLGSLASHLSADEGIVRLSTRYSGGPQAYVYFDPTKTNAEKIKAALVKTTLTIFITETETKDMENPFHIKPDGEVVQATSLNIDDDVE